MSSELARLAALGIGHLASIRSPDGLSLLQPDKGELSRPCLGNGRVSLLLRLSVNVRRG